MATACRYGDGAVGRGRRSVSGDGLHADVGDVVVAVVELGGWGCFGRRD